MIMIMIMMARKKKAREDLFREFVLLLGTFAPEARISQLRAVHAVISTSYSKHLLI